MEGYPVAASVFHASVEGSRHRWVLSTTERMISRAELTGEVCSAVFYLWLKAIISGIVEHAGSVYDGTSWPFWWHSTLTSTPRKISEQKVRLNRSSVKVECLREGKTWMLRSCVLISVFRSGSPTNSGLKICNRKKRQNFGINTSNSNSW